MPDEQQTTKGSRDYGALVGWSAEHSGQRLVLSLQSVITPPPHRSDDIHTQYLMLDRNQALQLGYYLLQLADQPSGARQRKGWLERRLLR